MARSLSILLVEDSEQDAELIEFELRRAGTKCAIERVASRGAMQTALGRGGWDVVVSDWSLPAFDALGALEELRRAEVDVPLIIVSGSIGEERAVEALRAGAKDYVLKDRLARLPHAIEHVVRGREEYQRARAEKSRAEEALRESSEAYRALFENSPVAMYALDATTFRVIEVNSTSLALYGYTRDEFLALGPKELRLDDAHLRRNGAAGTHSATATHSRKDGKEILVEMTSRIETLSGRSRIFVAVRDITAQQRAEEKLRQAQKMEAIGRLAGGVAHDFNNLLSVILSYGELLKENEALDEDTRGEVSEICVAGRRAADLTRQLLMFSRQQVLEPKVLSLHDVLASMRTMLVRMLGEDIHFVVSSHRASGHVRVDPGSIEQVIMNLVVNARDAMPKGGKLVIETSDVSLRRGDPRLLAGTKPGGRYVLLSVTDDGIGMDKATMARIFEPFFTTKERGKGTGLGLSTVFGIVEQSGGILRAESKPGHGARFEVFLPCTDEAVDAPEVTTAPKTLRGRETVLLVEDEEQVRVVASGILRARGYHVIVATDAEEAHRASRQHDGPIHLLLSDVVLPQMSGPELARSLAEMRPDMALLCMSGYTDDRVSHHGLDEQIAYLQKPFTPAGLATKVREVLDARGRGARRDPLAAPRVAHKAHPAR